MKNRIQRYILNMEKIKVESPTKSAAIFSEEAI